ncbi:MAG: GntR family transcriptional regulator [Candidatus Cloacimonetes bacterium]|nr:GntR family transcriptional regulator [Candidatus Cloacimonadota bacterium]
MNKSIPKYINVKHKIIEGIKNGSIVDKLPGERILAQEYNVSYMTIRKAITELTEEGILHKFTTKGTFVSNRKISPKATYNLGFFLDEEIKEGISSPYYSLIFKALEKTVKKNGYNMLLFSDSNDLNPLNNHKKIDGVIICCFPRLEQKIQEIKKLLPIVLLDNLAKDKSIPSITIDNFNSCYESTNYLWSLGHRHIGFISGLLDSDVCKERLQGYVSALNAYGMEEDAAMIFKGDYSYESGSKAAEYFLSLPEPPTAIMCANDSMAIGAMKVIQENGLKIPDDISIIGFDDIEIASRIFPTLTTNAAPITEMAEKSVSMLLSAISGKDIDYEHIIMPARLITRESCKRIR